MKDRLESLKGDYAELAWQMMKYTHSHRPLHDDLVDALSYQVQLARKGYGKADEKPEENTMMAIIEAERQRMNLTQRRLPRRYRKYYEPVFTE